MPAALDLVFAFHVVTVAVVSRTNVGQHHRCLVRLATWREAGSWTEYLQNETQRVCYAASNQAPVSQPFRGPERRVSVNREGVLRARFLEPQVVASHPPHPRRTGPPQLGVVRNSNTVCVLAVLKTVEGNMGWNVRNGTCLWVGVIKGGSHCDREVVVLNWNKYCPWLVVPAPKAS